jgi:surface protein
MAYDKVVDSAALDASLTAVADAIRAKGNTTAKLKLDDMPAAIAAIGVVDHTKGGVWQRPEGAPDLDALTYGTDELYMTYDCTERIDDPHASFRIYGTAYTVTIGTQSWTKAADEEFVYAFTSSDGSYPLVHIKADGNITGFNFTAYTVDGRSYEARANPVIERVGDVCDFGVSGQVWASYYVEREKVVRHKCANDYYGMNCVWQYCISLQSLDLSGWDTTSWAVTNLQYTWYYCSSLQSLDLSGWNTTNWAVTNLQHTWHYCSSLQSLDLSGWDTTSWAVTSLQYTWYSCSSLQSLDLSGWDTTNWAVTSLQYTWHYCSSLQSLDLSGWDTTSWAVTSLQYTWCYCSSLQSLDLSGWDTTNWAVTSLGSTWYYCFSLQSLDLSGWDTTNWAVTSLQYTWHYCFSLQSLDLSGWDTTNWNVTSLEYTFAQTHRLTYLDISCLDMSKILLFGGNYAALYSSIETFKCGESNYGKFTPTSMVYLKLNNPFKISSASLLEIGKMLGTVTTAHYLVIGSAASAKLTEAEKAEITAKGWTIS